MRWTRLAVFLAAMPAVAAAQIDMNGAFFVEDGPSLCTATFTQTGSALSVSGCGWIGSGTIDTVTGDFAFGADTIICGGIVGTATNGGADFRARYAVTGGSIVCFSGWAGSRHCHDGDLDPGETCDPGPIVDACCRSCSVSAAGSSCANDGSACTSDVCDGAGSCTHPPHPLGTSCTDSNVCTSDACDGAGTCVGTPVAGAQCTSDGNACTRDVCDAAGACTHPVEAGLACNDGNACTGPDVCDAEGACVPGADCPPCFKCSPDSGCAEIAFATVDGCDEPTAAGSPLVLKRGAVDARDTLSWRFAHGPAATPREFGDPLADTGYEVCAWAGKGELPPPFDGYTDLLFGTEIPPGATCANGKSCWKRSKTGFRYNDRSGQHGGLTSVRLGAGAEGKTQISIGGKGAGLDLPAVPLEDAVMMRISTDDGRCWQAEYSAPVRNDAAVYKAPLAD